MLLLQGTREQWLSPREEERESGTEFFLPVETRPSGRPFQSVLGPALFVIRKLPLEISLHAGRLYSKTLVIRRRENSNEPFVSCHSGNPFLEPGVQRDGFWSEAFPVTRCAPFGVLFVWPDGHKFTPGTIRGKGPSCCSEQTPNGFPVGDPLNEVRIPGRAIERQHCDDLFIIEAPIHRYPPNWCCTLCKSI